MIRKIVINALQYKRNSSGIGVLIRELFGAYATISPRTCQVILPKDSPPFPVRNPEDQIRIPFGHRQGIRRIWFQSIQMGARYCRDAILLTTDSKVPLLLPRSCVLVPMITDLAIFRMPQVYQLSRVILWKLQYRIVCKKARFFLTISEFSRREMMELLHIPAEKIRVIPCAYSPSLAPVERGRAQQKLCDYNLPEHFVLFVGNSNPRKNLERLIQAFDMAKEMAKLDQHLVIAGDQGWKFDRDKALQNLRHKNDVHFIGFVPDDAMAALYSMADLFVFPTLYEGFGIPVLEAQACGTPVLASSCSSLPEVGADAAIYANPYDCNDIAEKIVKVLMDQHLAKVMIEKGFDNIRRYSWQKSADLLSETIEEIIQ